MLPYTYLKPLKKKWKKKPVEVTEDRVFLEAFIPYGRIGRELEAGKEITHVQGRVQAHTEACKEITVYVASCLTDVKEVVPWASIDESVRGESLPYSLPTDNPKKIMEVVLTFHVSDISVSLRSGTEKLDCVYAVDSGV